MKKARERRTVLRGRRARSASGQPKKGAMLRAANLLGVGSCVGVHSGEKKIMKFVTESRIIDNCYSGFEQCHVDLRI